MFKSSIDTIEEFKNVLLQLPEGSYDQACDELSDATIGKHTRHIIELYQCLLKGYNSGQVSYDNRKRDKEIETDIRRAIEELNRIQVELERPNRTLMITYGLSGQETVIESNYFREVMYNLEHAIHHHALIKVGIQQLSDLRLPDNFGVAPATIEYRKLCAQ